MIKFQLIRDSEKKKFIVKEAIDSSREKWGDGKDFLKKIFPVAEVVAIARNRNGSIIAFCLAKNFLLKKCLAVGFFATRVQPQYRRQGIARSLIKKVILRSIVTQKLANIQNLFKPFYYVTVTANPIVFEGLSKHLHVIPSINSREPSNLEKDIANSFVKTVSSIDNFDKNSFILKGYYLDSAEYYKDYVEVPWSDNGSINTFMQKRIQYKHKKGNGLVCVGRIF